MRVVSVVLCVCAALLLFPCFAIAKEEHICEVLLDHNATDDGMTEVVLEFASSVGLCGVHGAAQYDAERLVLLSLGAEGVGAELSYTDLGGEVRFLIDGAENVGSGAAVSLFFLPKEGARGLATVSVCIFEAYFFMDGEPIGLDIHTEFESVLLDCSRGGEESLPFLSLYEYELVDGEVALRVRGSIGEGRVFGGVEVFIVREDGSGEKMLISRAIAPSEDGDLELVVRLGAADLRSVVITPVAFVREGCVKGEKVVTVGCSHFQKTPRRLGVSLRGFL